MLETIGVALYFLDLEDCCEASYGKTSFLSKAESILKLCESNGMLPPELPPDEKNELMVVGKNGIPHRLFTPHEWEPENE